MFGAIMGDIVGSRFEFDRGDKTKDFKLFTKDSVYTDDTVMSIAVAQALIESARDADERNIKEKVIQEMKKWGRKYPNAGYGGRFRGWLFGDDTKPYGSYGNGSAMRVSAVGWLYDSIERTREVARWTAEVTHNHPEGVKGAEATASVIYLARSGFDKGYIKEYVIKEFCYDLSRTCDEIRPKYHHVESCQQTVPEAITAFLEGEHYTDVVKTAVSLGGDADTLTDIAAAMAEAYYGMPKMFVDEIYSRLDDDLNAELSKFNEFRQEVVAVKRDWHAEPMPKEREEFTFERHFSPDEIFNLRRGNVPKQMEDKWFFYMRHNKLFAHRSWTGFLIFVIEFDFETGIHKVTSNRDEEQFSSNTSEDIPMVNELLNWWIQPHYDYYNQWISETYKNMKKAGLIEEPEEHFVECGDDTSDIFWFELDENENPVAVYPSGERVLFCGSKEEAVKWDCDKAMKKTKQLLQGYKRSLFYMGLFNIWDATAFGCNMNTTLCYGPDEEGKCYTFTTCQNAELHTYKNLTKEQVNQCRRNVRDFYKDKDLQLKWFDVILRPICMILYKDGTVEPVPVGDLNPDILKHMRNDWAMTPINIGQQSYEYIFD